MASSDRHASLRLVSDLPIEADEPVALQRFGTSRRVAMRGRLSEVVDAGYQSILMALAEEPAEVVCDLTGVTGPMDAEAVDVLASVGCEVEHWPGSRVGMICPDAALRRELAQQPDTRYVVLGERRAAVLSRLADGPARTIMRLPLPAEAQSASVARQRVAEVCLDWGCGIQLEAATLIVSEMVTNALLHAGTMLELSVARCEDRLRLAVADGNTGRPQPQPLDTAGVTGRGMLLVAAFSRAWGVLPAADGGKVVWAVLDV